MRIDLTTASGSLWVVRESLARKGGYLPQVKGEHVCACGSCDPELRARGERLGVAHFSVHLGDRRLTPFLEEWPLAHVFEIVVGVGGWALLSSQPGHLCHACRREPCTYKILSNELSIRQIENAPMMELYVNEEEVAAVTKFEIR
jgi:hypothetical protein